MSWLDRFARPKVRGLFRKPDIPEDLWEKCTNCEQMIFHRELSANMRVCPHCGFHMRLTPAQRFAYLFDESEYQTIELPEVPVDPLRFRDRKKYTDRLRDARVDRSNSDDALVVAHGQIGDRDAVVAAFDFSFLGGSMGMAVGDGLVSAARLAVLQKAPLIVVPAIPVTRITSWAGESIRTELLAPSPTSSRSFPTANVTLPSSSSLGSNASRTNDSCVAYWFIMVRPPDWYVLPSRHHRVSEHPQAKSY